MQLSHRPRSVSVRFDDPNLVSSGGLVPVMALAESAGLRDLADERLSVSTDKGANAGLKVSSLVAGMVAGADSIDDMALLRHGGMGRVFEHAYAPSTLGSFLRAFTFGHVRQLDAVASRLLTGLAGRAPLVGDVADGDGEFVLVDVDDTIIEVHGYAKQGAGFGYSGVRGLNALLATLTTTSTAPVIVAQRLRKGSCGSPRGAKRLVTDALKTVRGLAGLSGGTPLVRADSAFYGRGLVLAAVRAGAEVSVTVRLDKRVKAAIAGIAEDAWTTIEYKDAIHDEQTGRWISRAEVAEIPFTAFASRSKAEQVPGRLVVRRIPDLNTDKAAGQETLFDIWRFHAFFTTVDAEVMDTVTADKTHRGHAIIEQVNADLKNSALAHLPSGAFAANAAWLVCAVMAFNLTRAAATLTGSNLAKATTPTIRRKLINIAARIASSARRITLHLPSNWPWQTPWSRL
ncbi:MAG: IS1380 family transposase, partial [Catenulispora sp.]